MKNVDKIDKIVEIVSMICALIALIGFVYFMIADINNGNHLNFGRMAICLGLFWLFLSIGKAISKANEKTEEFSIPEEGRRIRITWLPHCINVPSNNPNPYIGMEGYVRELKPDGSFHLQCETSWLIVFGKYKFEYLD